MSKWRPVQSQFGSLAANERLVLVMKALHRHDYDEVGALTASAPRVESVLRDPPYFARLAGIRSAVFVFAILIGQSLRKIDTTGTSLIMRLELLTAMGASELTLTTNAGAARVLSWLPPLENLASASRAALASGKATVLAFERFADRLGVSPDELTSWWPPLKDDLQEIATMAEAIEPEAKVAELVLEILLFQAGEPTAERQNTE